MQLIHIRRAYASLAYSLRICISGQMQQCEEYPQSHLSSERKSVHPTQDPCRKPRRALPHLAVAPAAERQLSTFIGRLATRGITHFECASGYSINAVRCQHVRPKPLTLLGDRKNGLKTRAPTWLSGRDPPSSESI